MTSNRGLLAVLAAALGGAGLLFVLRGPSTPGIKVPGPCEVLRTLSPIDPPMPTDRLEHRYDPQGHGILEERFIDGRSHESTRRAYDVDGHMILEEHFVGGPIIRMEPDGTNRTLDQQLSRTRWTYDADGRMLTRELERDGDGVVQHTTRYAYDPAGVRVSSHAEWDGKYSSDSTYEYDAAGRLVAERSDAGAQSIVRYEHDADGRVVRETHDYLADGAIELAITRQYDADGRVVLETIDEGVAGTREVHFTYDDAGNMLTRREQFGHGEGEVPMELLEAYDYRCWTVRDGQAVDERPPPSQ